ncbi:MAG: hypothetical protein ACPLY7_00335, partial [Microgenomates group bacterium]
MKRNLKKAKSSALFFVSSVSFVLLVWMLIFGKIKATQVLSSLFSKLPHNDSEFVQQTEKVLGTAVQNVRGENFKRTVQKGSNVFENSQVAEPAREIREDVKKKVNETVEEMKKLPEKEV